MTTQLISPLHSLTRSLTPCVWEREGVGTEGDSHSLPLTPTHSHSLPPTPTHSHPLPLALRRSSQSKRTPLTPTAPPTSPRPPPHTHYSSTGTCKTRAAIAPLHRAPPRRGRAGGLSLRARPTHTPGRSVPPSPSTQQATGPACLRDARNPTSCLHLSPIYQPQTQTTNQH